MSDMYQAQLLDHARNPRNYGPLTLPQIHGHGTNHSCGDNLDIYAKVEPDGLVSKLNFTGQGCVLSQAAASITCQAWEGKTVSELSRLTETDVLNLVGIQPGPMRLNCVLLSWRALNTGLKLWQKD